MADPLNRLFRKEAKPTYHKAFYEQRQELEALNESLVEPPVSALPVSNRRFLLDTDSLAY